jgi:NTE family protein
MVTAAPTESLRRFDPRRALLVASLGALLAFLDATIVNVAFPAIQTSFAGSSIGSLSWVLNAYNIVFAAFLVPAGRLADLLGRRRMFTIGIVVFTLASAVCAAAPSLAWLVAARGFQAAGAALLVPASLALVVAAFPAERRAHAVGLWSASAAAAAGLGPPLGGVLVAAGGWRLAFLVNVPIGVGAVLAARRSLVESRAPGRRRLPDLAGAGALALGLGLLTLAIVEGGTWGWASARVLVSVAAAVACLGLVVGRSSRHPSPVVDPVLLRTRQFSAASALSFVAGAGFFAYLLCNILWLHYVWGWSLLRAGLAVAPAALVAAGAAGPLGKLAARHGARIVAGCGAVVWMCAYLWYATRVGVHPAFVSEWLPGQVLSGLGVAATLPVLGGAALAGVPGGRFATASSVVTSARQLGGVLGVALLVVIVGQPDATTLVDRLRHGWLLSAACFLVVAVGSLALLRRTPDGVIEDDAPELAPRLELAPVPDVDIEPREAEASLFAVLPAETRAELVASATAVEVRGGETVFEAGDPPDAAYIVASGRLEVVAGDEMLVELRADDVVGELGLLAGTPRAATVRARRDSILLRIEPRHLERALGGSAAQRALTAVLARQLQASRPRTSASASRPRVLAVVAATEGAPVVALADGLAEALGTRETVVALAPEHRDALDRAESGSDRVLLVAGPDDAREWHDFCLRQADCAVLLADTSQRPFDLAPPRTSYIVFTDEAPSRQTIEAWHDRLQPRRSFVGVDRAVDEIVSRVTGTSVGVALAGGGARAFAAIGVLAELEDSGVRIDRLSGCSMGAIVAAAYATGRSAADVDAVCFDEFVRRNPLGDLALPRVALSRGRRADAALRRQFGDTIFEELPRQLAVVSTDMLSRSVVVHRRGSLRDAVRASFSLPVVLPPARIGDTIHVDGGILDNLPVTALDAEEGPTIAVNISTGGSGGSGPPRIPPLADTMLRSMLMGSAAAAEEARRRAAITVTPDTRGIGLFEFHQIDRAIDAGRAAGAAVVAALRDPPTAAPLSVT